MNNSSYAFLAIGNTNSSERKGSDGKGFARYVGIGAAKILAVNPTKEELMKIYGTDKITEPQYVSEENGVKKAQITFIVKTVPEDCNGIETIGKVQFILRNAPAYNKNETTVDIIDVFGNCGTVPVEVANAKGTPVSVHGKALKVTSKYRKAYDGEPAFTNFVKCFLCTKDAFDFVNGAWIKKPGITEETEHLYYFKFDRLKDIFNGDFSEIRQAIKLQEDNKIKLLFGVKTTPDNRQIQVIANLPRLVLRNDLSGENLSKALARMEQELIRLKNANMYSNVEFKVQELQEYSLEPTNLETAPQEADSSDVFGEAPW